MFTISSVSYSCIVKITVYAFRDRRLFTRMWRNSERIFVLLWIERLLIESSTTRAFRSGFLRSRNSTFSMMFSSIVGLSTTIEWGWRFAWDIMICVMQSMNQMCSTGISRASIAFRMLWLGIVDVT